MKKTAFFYLLIIMGLIVSISACKRKTNDLSAKEAQAIAAKADTLVEAEPAGLQIDTIRKSCFYKASIDRPLYGELSCYVEWPLSLEGADLSELQRALLRKTFGEKKSADIHEVVENLFREYDPTHETRWTRIDKIPTRTEESWGEELPSDNYPMEDSYTRYTVKLDSYQEESGLIEYSIYVDYNTGMLIGPSYGDILNHIIFDTKAEKLVRFNDVFVPDARAFLIGKLRRDPVLMEKYECLWGEDDDMGISDLPENFMFKNGCIFFVFPKYEAACGSDGSVCLGVKLSEVKRYLTPYGAKLVSGL